MSNDSTNETPSANVNLGVPPEALALMADQAQRLEAMLEEGAALHRRIEDLLAKRAAAEQRKGRRKHRKKYR